MAKSAIVFTLAAHGGVDATVQLSSNFGRRSVHDMHALAQTSISPEIQRLALVLSAMLALAGRLLNRRETTIYRRQPRGVLHQALDRGLA